MRRLYFFIVTAALALAMLLTTTAFAALNDYGMVLDLEGELVIVRQGEEIAGDLGDTLFVDDQLIVAAKARVTVVTYLDCQEFHLSGPAEVRITWEGFQTASQSQSNLISGRNLPVCYSQEDLRFSDSQMVGGLVLRGAANDPVAALRQEFAHGEASISTLMTLIMHDLANGELERASHYLEALHSRVPGTPFVARMERQIAEQTAQRQHDVQSE